MKRKSLLLIPLLFVGSMSVSSAAGYDCDAKRLEVERLIDKADDDASPGLATALKELTANCTDSTLITKSERKVRKLERKVKSKEDDIVQAQSDLAEAKAEGKTLKIAKYERKIKSKQAELDEIREELEAQKNIVKELQQPH